MVVVLRSLARRLGMRTEDRSPAPEASEWLRRRVLANVRGEGEQSPVPPPAGVARRDRAAHLAAGALVGAAVVLALTLVLGDGSPTRPTPAASRGHSARATLRRIGARAELVISDMSQPPIGEVYELWLDRSGRPPEPTDELFTVTSAGNGAVEVPGGLRGVSDVIVTSEPLGGSTRPTSLPTLRVKPPRS